MSFGTLLKDQVGTPIAQGYSPGIGFEGMQSSILKNTDSSSNTTAPAVMSNMLIESALNGMAYSILQNQTVGSSGGGQYAISVFNPSTSGKNVLIYSIKCMANYGNTTTWLYLTTSNPSYNTNLTPTNLKAGGSASALTSGNVTTNSASISFPGSGLFDMTVAASEVLTNNTGIYLPNGSSNGLTALVNVANSQEYAITLKWIEF